MILFYIELDFPIFERLIHAPSDTDILGSPEELEVLIEPEIGHRIHIEDRIRSGGTWITISTDERIGEILSCKPVELAICCTTEGSDM